MEQTTDYRFLKMHRLFTIILVFISYSHFSFASIYEYQYKAPSEIDVTGFAHYKIFIPDVDTIRGVYCYVPGWQSSSLDIVNNQVYQEYVTEKGFALMGFQMLGKYTDYYEGIGAWSGQALELALKQLALISGHAELEHSAMLFDGHSAGGQFSYHFARYKPERVISFVCIKGGYHTLSAAGDAIHVPAYMFIGEYDESHRLKNLPQIFSENRPNGALWAIATELNATHGRVPKDIIHAYFDRIIPLRLPVEIPMDHQPKLISIHETFGWLGNPYTLEINSYNNFTGNKGSASWFPDELSAIIWKRFIQGEAIDLSLDTDRSSGIEIYPNPVQEDIYFNQKNHEGCKYNIYNLNGISKKTGYVEDHKIHTNDLANGIYLLSLSEESIWTHQKIIIQKRK